MIFGCGAPAGTIVGGHWVEASVDVDAGDWIAGLEVSASFPDGDVDEGTRVILLRPEMHFDREVEVPAALFVRIKNLAETQRDLNEYASKLKTDLAETGLFTRKD